MLPSTWIVVLVGLVTCFLQHVVSQKPNIVIIIADDTGRNDIGYLGSEIPTPNIDALAYSGVILNRHYAHPACSPSRAALLTGKYASRLGLQGAPIPVSVKMGLDPKEKIMPQYFKELGYSTHLVGKWHLGYYTPKHLPINRGFDTFFGYLNGFVGYYDGVQGARNLSGLDAWRNGTKAWHEFYNKYLPTLIADEAVDVIKSHAAQGKKDGLFMIVASLATHHGNRKLNLEPPPFTYGDRLKNVSDANRRLFADLMIGLDNTVGDVAEALKQNEMLDNSIIVFFSDNGAPSTDKIWGYENFGSNWPLKGEKMSVHEGGVRTAAAVWSSLFPVGTSRSKVNNGLFHITDWLPTLYSAAGGNLSNLVDINGVNQWDSLHSGKQLNRRDELLVDMEDDPEVEAVIKGKWKLVKNYDRNSNMAFLDEYQTFDRHDFVEYNITEIYLSKVGQSLTDVHLNDSLVDQLRAQGMITNICNPQQKAESKILDCHNKYCLYNIETDPCECSDVAASHKDIVRKLTTILNKHRKTFVKRGNDTFDINGYPHESNYWEPWIDVAQSSKH